MQDMQREHADTAHSGADLLQHIITTFSAENDSRSPRFNGARGEDYVVFMEFANNVNFNWGRWNLSTEARTLPT